mmetsp:Transcript_20746/g.79577  ORF Transcript_20746/g.79577 Transcript_20746/m.79577 type:complete len:239 (+) Transcript_20746:753-1469(+)
MAPPLLLAAPGCGLRQQAGLAHRRRGPPRPQFCTAYLQRPTRPCRRSCSRRPRRCSHCSTRAMWMSASGASWRGPSRRPLPSCRRHTPTTTRIACPPGAARVAPTAPLAAASSTASTRKRAGCARSSSSKHSSCALPGWRRRPRARQRPPPRSGRCSRRLQHAGRLSSLPVGQRTAATQLRRPSFQSVCRPPILPRTPSAQPQLSLSRVTAAGPPRAALPQATRQPLPSPLPGRPARA